MRENTYPSMESDITFADLSMAPEMDLQDDVLKGRYLEEIKKLVGQEGEKGRPLRVAVIGAPGAGKSSFINTVGAAFRTDRWREFATYGHHGGDADPISTFTAIFNKCCNEEAYPDHKLPTLIDIAGIPNEDKEKWRELLRIVFYGRLREGEALGQAQELCEREGLQKLLEHYSGRTEELKVDRIIFVASATQEVPRNLINCVLAAARPSGRSSNPATRNIPVFGVLTKKDKFPQDDSLLRKRQTELMEALGLGNAGHRFLLCSNYCDDVDGGLRTERVMPQLDWPVLKFLCQVFDPYIRVLNDQETMVEALRLPVPEGTPAQPEPAQEPGARAGEGARQARGMVGVLQDQMQQLGLAPRSTELMLMAVEAVLVAAIFYYLMRPAVDVGDLRSSCMALQDRHLFKPEHLDNVPRLKELCNQLDARESIHKVLHTLGLICFLALRAGITLVIHAYHRQP